MTIQRNDSGGEMKKPIRMMVGAVGGMTLYCSFIMLKELRHLVFRGYFDWEGVVYQCLLPIGVFTLFSKSMWQGVPLWANLEMIFGAALTSLGLVIGARKTSSRKATPLP